MELVLWLLLLFVSAGASVGVTAAYRNGVSDGFGFAIEPLNPGYRKAGAILEQVSPPRHITPITRRLPNAVMQTLPTNCFSACVATVLGIGIDDVPAGCNGATWDWDEFQDWLADRGLQAVELTFGNGGTIYPVRRPVRCIISGKSPRECATGQHAVVASLIGVDGFELEHDPHPSQLWIDGDPTHAVFFVPTDVRRVPTLIGGAE